MNSSIVFSGEVEGSVDIVIGFIIVLDCNANRLYIILLVECDRHAYNEQQSRELQNLQKIITKGAAFMADKVRADTTDKLRNMVNWYIVRKNRRKTYVDYHASWITEHLIERPKNLVQYATIIVKWIAKHITTSVVIVWPCSFIWKRQWFHCAFLF